MKIIQVIPEGENSPVAISGISTIFRMAQSHGLPLQYQVVSAQKKRKIRVGDFELITEKLIDEVEPPDFVILPSLIGNPDNLLAANKKLIDWLSTVQSKGTQIASLCTGAYILAATGLLNKQDASSHCGAIMDLKLRFPKVNWRPEKIITDYKGLYTSGGTLSSFNLVIYLLEKYFDKTVAHQIAKFMQMDYPRKSQKPFFIFSNQKKHGDRVILSIQEYIEQYFQQTIYLDDLAQQFHLSRRSLNRRFKEATGMNPQAYIQRIKVEHAKSLLEQGDLSINEIMYRIGYNDGLSFRRLFVKVTGELPSIYRKKFA